MGRLTDYFGSGSGGGSGWSGSGGGWSGVDVVVDAGVEREMQERLSRMMVSDKDLRREIQRIIRKSLMDAAKRMRKDVRGALKSDPRSAYRAVKTTIYKSLLGGNVSILNPRRAGIRYKLVKARKLDANPKQRGGNRRKRSERTEMVDSYFGKDRAFILRFNNSGTGERETRFGKRGMIRGRDFFSVSAGFQMATAEAEIAKMIEEEVARIR